MKLTEEMRVFVPAVILLSAIGLHAEPADSADHQGKGKLVRANSVVRHFLEKDKNNDGFLDFSERAKIKRSDLKAAFEGFDTDKDGRVSVPELRKGIETKPELKDSLKEVFQKFQKRLEKKLPFDSKGGFTLEDVRKKWQPKRIERVFRAFDLNSDKCISPAEGKTLKASLLAVAISEIIIEYARHAQLDPLSPTEKRDHSQRMLGIFLDLDGDGTVTLPETVKFLNETCDEKTGKFVESYLTENAHFISPAKVSSPPVQLVRKPEPSPVRKPAGETKTVSKPSVVHEPPKTAASQSVKTEPTISPPSVSLQPAGFIISNPGPGSVNVHSDPDVLREILGDSSEGEDYLY